MHRSTAQTKLADIRGAAMPFEFDIKSGAVTVSNNMSELKEEAIRRGYIVRDSRIHLSPVEMAERLNDFFSTKTNSAPSPEN
jgi:formiminotetrahydrofolate cyclodeaminase